MTSNIDPIATKEADIARLRREIEIAEAELRGMKMMRDKLVSSRIANATPEKKSVVVKSGQKSAPLSGGYRGGRQPGAISKPWRRILSELYWTSGLFGGAGQPFAVEEVVDAAAHEGIRLRQSEAEARLKHYSHFKYVAVSAGDFGKYVVTDEAADKFGFRQGPLKDEAPSAEAREPQKSLDPGDQTGAD